MNEIEELCEKLQKAEGRAAELERELKRYQDVAQSEQSSVLDGWIAKAAEWQAHAARLASQEERLVDLKNAALRYDSAQYLAALEAEHQYGETVADGLNREDPECNCDECNWIRARGAVEAAWKEGKER